MYIDSKSRSQEANRDRDVQKQPHGAIQAYSSFSCSWHLYTCMLSSRKPAAAFSQHVSMSIIINHSHTGSFAFKILRMNAGFAEIPPTGPKAVRASDFWPASSRVFACTSPSAPPSRPAIPSPSGPLYPFAPLMCIPPSSYAYACTRTKDQGQVLRQTAP